MKTDSKILIPDTRKQLLCSTHLHYNSLIKYNSN